MSILLTTERLILKTLQHSDLEDLIALRTDPDVMRYIGDGNIHTEEQVKKYLTMAIAYQEKHGLGFCMVFEKEGGAFIGEAGLFHLGYDDAQPEIEIAYRFHKKFWKKGYATEVVRALVEWGFENLSINTLIAGISLENRASKKVLIKAGLEYSAERKWYDGRKLLCYAAYKNEAVELVRYNTQWPKMAEDEIKILRAAFLPYNIVDIQHVGSTAIPSILAKPVLDIQIAVTSLLDIKQTAIDVLGALGYQYWAENPDPERLFFVKGMPPFGVKRTHHVHIVEPGSKHWAGKILFRDYLIAYPEVAREYEVLKKVLAKKYKYNREKYTEAKSDFVNGVLLQVKK